MNCKAFGVSFLNWVDFTLSFWYTLKLGYSYYQAVALHGLEWCRRRHTAADQTLIYGEMTIIVGVIILCSLLDNHGLISMPDIWIKSSQNYTEWLASSLSFSNFLLEPWTRNCFCWKEIWISYTVLKGRLISEWNFGVFKSPKKPLKKAKSKKKNK